MTAVVAPKVLPLPLSEHGRMQHVNTNTYVSLGVLIVLLGGFGWVIKGQNDTKGETRDMKNELSTQALITKNELKADIKDLQTRMTNMEATKSSWTSTDMFKWAVHLQQLNRDPKKLQTEGLVVPEPEVTVK